MYKESSFFIIAPVYIFRYNQIHRVNICVKTRRDSNRYTARAHQLLFEYIPKQNNIHFNKNNNKRGVKWHIQPFRISEKR